MNTSSFDERAKEWDTPRRVALAEAVSGAILERIDFTSPLRIVDFGAGTGLVSLALSGRAEKVLAVDSSAGMLEVLTEKARRQGIKNVEALYSENFGESVEKNAWDLIVSSLVLHHVKDHKALIQQLYDLLQPGGRIALADLEKEEGDFHDSNEEIHHFGFSPEEILEIFEGAGFQDIKIDRIYEMEKKEKNKRFGVFLVTATK